METVTEMTRRLLREHREHRMNVLQLHVLSTTVPIMRKPKPSRSMSLTFGTIVFWLLATMAAGFGAAWIIAHGMHLILA